MKDRGQQQDPLVQIEQVRALLPADALGQLRPGSQEGRKEFDPLEGVTKHWTQAQLCFRALREQFPDVESTVGFMHGAVDYAESLEQYQRKVLEGIMDNPRDVRYFALLGVISNLLTCGQLSEPIRASIPRPRNHSGYDNDAELRRELIPCLYTTDILVKSLGLAVMSTESPFNELQGLAQRRARREMPQPLV